jgi:hypothetical protein
MELEPLCTGVFLVNLNFQALTPKGGSIVSALTQGGGVSPKGLKNFTNFDTRASPLSQIGL